MKHILVIGSGGAGKSCFAAQLAARTGLPLIHLDAYYWRSGWEALPDTEWIAKVDELLAGEQWIMDGNFGGTLERRLSACDTVVFLDLPMWLCLWRVVRRRIQFHGRARPDMTSGCNERLTVDFLWWIISYPVQRRPALRRRLAQLRPDQQVFVIRTARMAETLLQSLAQT